MEETPIKESPTKSGVSTSDNTEKGQKPKKRVKEAAKTTTNRTLDEFFKASAKKKKLEKNSTSGRESSSEGGCFVDIESDDFSVNSSNQEPKTEDIKHKKKKKSSLKTCESSPGIVTENKISEKLEKRKELKQKLKEEARERRLKTETTCRICQKPDDLIACHRCGRKYHKACLELTEEQFKEDWKCSNCESHLERKLKRREEKEARKNEKKEEKKLKKLFILFKKIYPECIKDNAIKYPIDDEVLYKMPDLHKLKRAEKPKLARSLIPKEELGTILELWNSLIVFKKPLKLGQFGIEELYASLKSNTEVLLLKKLLLNLSNAFIAELSTYPFERRTGNSQMLIVELDQELPLIWPEIVRLILSIPKNLHLVPPDTNILKELARLTPVEFYLKPYEFKLEVLTVLINVAFSLPNLRKEANDQFATRRDMRREKETLLREIKQYERDCQTLRKDIEALQAPITTSPETTSANSNPTTKPSQTKAKEEEKKENGVINEKDANETQKGEKIEKSEDEVKNENNKEKMLQTSRSELDRLEKGIKGKKVQLERLDKKILKVRTSVLGNDGQKRVYYTFQGDKGRIYVQSFSENAKDSWGFYNSERMVNELIEAVSDKGFEEKKLLKNLLEVKELLVFPYESSTSASSEDNPDEMKDEETNEELMERYLIKANEGFQAGKKKYHTRKMEDAEEKIGYAMLIDKIIELEEEHMDFLKQRNLEWVSKNERDAWLNNGETLSKSDEKDIKKLIVWMWEFFRKAPKITVSPNSKITPALHSIKKEDPEYEFTFSQDSNFEEEENKKKEEEKENIETEDSKEEKHEEKMEEEKEDYRDDYLFTFWKNYGGNSYNYIHDYMKEIQGLCQIYAIYAFYYLLIGQFHDIIIDKEKDLAKKKDKENAARNEKFQKALQMKYLEDFEYDEDEPRETRQYHRNEKRGRSARLAARNAKKQIHKDFQEWDEICFYCGEYGELLCCDTCPNVAHVGCAGLEKKPTGLWQCEACMTRIATTRQTRAQTKKLQKLEKEYV